MKTEVVAGAIAEKSGLIPEIIIAGVVIGVVAGLGIGIYKVVKKEKNSNPEPNSYAYLVKNQKVLDNLDSTSVMTWFREKGKLTRGKAIYFLAKPSANTSKLFGLDRVPKGLDAEHSMLQCVVDEATKLPAAIRLISYSRMSEKLRACLDEKEYVIIKDK